MAKAVWRFEAGGVLSRDGVPMFKAFLHDELPASLQSLIDAGRWAEEVHGEGHGIAGAMNFKQPAPMKPAFIPPTPPHVKREVVVSPAKGAATFADQPQNETPLPERAAKSENPPAIPLTQRDLELRLPNRLQRVNPGETAFLLAGLPANGAGVPVNLSSRILFVRALEIKEDPVTRSSRVVFELQTPPHDRLEVNIEAQRIYDKNGNDLGEVIVFAVPGAATGDYKAAVLSAMGYVDMHSGGKQAR